MLLDRTYFQGELALPQLATSYGPSVGVAQATQITGEYSLEWFITKYEADFLDKLLGKSLAKAFTDGINASPPDEIWVRLRDQIYRVETVSGIKMGFSPAANYVYYWAMRNSRTQTAMIGEVESKSDNAYNRSAQYKLVKNWNDMAGPIHSIYQFLSENWDDYKEYAKGKVCPCGSWYAPINVYNI